jgi:hypothetical protein
MSALPSAANVVDSGLQAAAWLNFVYFLNSYTPRGKMVNLLHL